MAYSTKYQVTVAEDSGWRWRVNIQPDGWGGGITDLTPDASFLSWTVRGSGTAGNEIFAPLRPGAIQFAIRDVTGDVLLELASGDRRDYRIVVERQRYIDGSNTGPWQNVWYGLIVQDFYQDRPYEPAPRVVVEATDGMELLKGRPYRGDPDLDASGEIFFHEEADLVNEVREILMAASDVANTRPGLTPNLDYETLMEWYFYTTSSSPIATDPIQELRVRAQAFREEERGDTPVYQSEFAFLDAIMSRFQMRLMQSPAPDDGGTSTGSHWRMQQRSNLIGPHATSYVRDGTLQNLIESGPPDERDVSDWTIIGSPNRRMVQPVQQAASTYEFKEIGQGDGILLNNSFEDNDGSFNEWTQLSPPSGMSVAVEDYDTYSAIPAGRSGQQYVATLFNDGSSDSSDAFEGAATQSRTYEFDSLPRGSLRLSISIGLIPDADVGRFPNLRPHVDVEMGGYHMTSTSHEVLSEAEAGLQTLDIATVPGEDDRVIIPRGATLYYVVRPEEQGETNGLGTLTVEEPVFSGDTSITGTLSHPLREYAVLQADSSIEAQIPELRYFSFLSAQNEVDLTPMCQEYTHSGDTFQGVPVMDVSYVFGTVELQAPLIPPVGLPVEAETVGVTLGGVAIPDGTHTTRAVFDNVKLLHVAPDGDPVGQRSVIASQQDQDQPEVEVSHSIGDGPVQQSPGALPTLIGTTPIARDWQRGPYTSGDDPSGRTLDDLWSEWAVRQRKDATEVWDVQFRIPEPVDRAWTEPLGTTNDLPPPYGRSFQFVVRPSEGVVYIATPRDGDDTSGSYTVSVFLDDPTGSASFNQTDSSRDASPVFPNCSGDTLNFPSSTEALYTGTFGVGQDGAQLHIDNFSSDVTVRFEVTEWVPGANQWALSAGATVLEDYQTFDEQDISESTPYTFQYPHDYQELLPHEVVMWRGERWSIVDYERRVGRADYQGSTARVTLMRLTDGGASGITYSYNQASRTAPSAGGERTLVAAPRGSDGGGSTDWDQLTGIPSILAPPGASDPTTVTLLGSHVETALGYTPADETSTVNVSGTVGEVEVFGDAQQLFENPSYVVGLPSDVEITSSIILGGGNITLRDDGSGIFGVYDGGGSSLAQTLTGSLRLANREAANLADNGEVIYDQSDGLILRYDGGLAGHPTNATIWDSFNDGPGSGMEADLLDGLHGDAYAVRAEDETIGGQWTFSDGLTMGDSEAADLINNGQIIYDQSDGLILRYDGGLAGHPVNATIWDSFNDGAGSGMDADLLDGLQGAAYAVRAENETIPGSWTITGQWSFDAQTMFSNAILMETGAVIADAEDLLNNRILLAQDSEFETERVLRLRSNATGGIAAANAGFNFEHNGSNLIEIRGDGTATLLPPVELFFGSSQRQMLNLYSNTFGIGVQTSTHYFRTGSSAQFAWYQGGSHVDAALDPGGGTRLMAIDDTEMVVWPDLKPDPTGSDLGSSTSRWDDFYVTTTFHESSSGEKVLLDPGEPIALGVQNRDMYIRTDEDFYLYQEGTHSDTEGDAGGGAHLLDITSDAATFYGDVDPAVDLGSSLGDSAHQYLTAHIAELRVQTFVASEERTTMGGLFTVTRSTKIFEGVQFGADHTHYIVEHNNLNLDDVVWLQAHELFEAMRVANYANADPGEAYQTISNYELPDGSTVTAYRYRFERNLDGSGYTDGDWKAGDTMVNTGSPGSGMIEMIATDSLTTGDSITGPVTRYRERTGTGWNDLTTMAAVGKLDDVTMPNLAPTGYGLAAENVFLKGLIQADEGRIGQSLLLGDDLLNHPDINGNAAAGSLVGTGQPGFVAQEDANNRVTLKWNSSSDWGIRGTVGGSGIFQLGDTNQISGWDFAENRLLHQATNGRIVLWSQNTTNQGPYIGTPSGVPTVGLLSRGDVGANHIYAHVGETYSAGWTGRYGFSFGHGVGNDAWFEMSRSLSDETADPVSYISAFDFDAQRLSATVSGNTVEIGDLTNGGFGYEVTDGTTQGILRATPSPQLLVQKDTGNRFQVGTGISGLTGMGVRLSSAGNDVLTADETGATITIFDFDDTNFSTIVDSTDIVLGGSLPHGGEGLEINAGGSHYVYMRNSGGDPQISAIQDGDNLWRAGVGIAGLNGFGTLVRNGGNDILRVDDDGAFIDSLTVGGNAVFENPGRLAWSEPWGTQNNLPVAGATRSFQFVVRQDEEVVYIGTPYDNGGTETFNYTVVVNIIKGNATWDQTNSATNGGSVFPSGSGDTLTFNSSTEVEYTGSGGSGTDAAQLHIDGGFGDQVELRFEITEWSTGSARWFITAGQTVLQDNQSWDGSFSASNPFVFHYRSSSTLISGGMIDTRELFAREATIANTLTTGVNGTIQSANYSAGSDGYAINPSGNFDVEFNSGVFRGSLDAASGTFSGTLSAVDGTFTGTLQAVDGDFSGTLSAASGTFAGTLQAVDGDFSGSLTAASGTFTGTLNGVDGNFSGEIFSTAGGFGGTEASPHVVIDSNGLSAGGGDLTLDDSGIFIDSNTTSTGRLNWSGGLTGFVGPVGANDILALESNTDVQLSTDGNFFRVTNSEFQMGASQLRDVTLNNPISFPDGVIVNDLARMPVYSTHPDPATDLDPGQAGIYGYINTNSDMDFYFYYHRPDGIADRGQLNN